MRYIFIIALVLSLISPASAADWQPGKGPLMTRWAKEVTPEKVLPEYPRPQMVRKEWVNLNGLWDYAILPAGEQKASEWTGKIMVPFVVQSALSGVMKPVSEKERLWYRRTFKTPEMKKDGRLLLHFGAVDWEANVWVNGKKVGMHKGGYTPFSFDITDALKTEGEQELVVSVWDGTDGGYQPRGKQVKKPEGIWYTAVTGIWQTVWLEPVGKAYIKSFQVTLLPDKKAVRFSGKIGGRELNGVYGVIRERGDSWPPTPPNSTDGFKPLKDEYSFEFEEPISKVTKWTPENPVLYDVSIKVTARAGEDTFYHSDEIDGYTAFRDIELRKDDAGHNRLFLNNKPVFQYGPLDQGWWPDGLYTAPTDAALAFDVEITKKLGMNMCRKHVKVEPARWYYHCDRLGLLVWQDMPNGDRHIGGSDPDIERTAESEANFRREWQEIMDSCMNYPCIVAWVPFNEGWGQFKTNEILAWTKKHDPTRLVDGPSGWTDRGEGDMHDMHAYPGPGMFPVSDKRASVLGEFGGLGLPIKGRLWQDRDNWGYRTYKTQEELQSHYESLIHKLRPLIGRGLAAAIYTQTTDVEGEVNGLMTYDREIVKLDPVRVAALHAKLYEPPSTWKVNVVAATSEREGQKWRYTTTMPAEGWTEADFDDAKWQEGEGGFGTEQTPGTKVRTKWDSRDIWIRRTVEIENADLSKIQFRVYHDEDAEVYINGVPAGRFSGYTINYVESELSEKGKAALKKGKNTIAVHCKQTRGGQYIDVGLIEVIEIPAKKP